MSKRIAIVCPVSDQKANENVIRIIAFYVVLITLISLYSGNPLPAAFLSLDFFLRAYTNGRFSILKQLSAPTATVLHIRPRPIPAAPKKFAAALGFVFSLLVVVTQLLGLDAASLVIGGLLVVCAVLESVFAICIGCYVYTFISKFQKTININP